MWSIWHFLLQTCFITYALVCDQFITSFSKHVFTWVSWENMSVFMCSIGHMILQARFIIFAFVGDQFIPSFASMLHHFCIRMWSNHHIILHACFPWVFRQTISVIMCSIGNIIKTKRLCIYVIISLPHLGSMLLRFCIRMWSIHHII